MSLLTLDGLFRERIEQDAEASLASILSDISRGRTGGTFCLLSTQSMTPELPITEIGSINTGNSIMYDFCSYEKGIRLGMCMDPDDYLTWVSYVHRRDPILNRWGGAVYAGSSPSTVKYIASFSGFTEYEDEAMALLTLIRLGMMTESEALAITGVSNNTFYKSNMALGIPAVETANLPLGLSQLEFHCPCGNDHALEIPKQYQLRDNIIPVILPCSTYVNFRIED